MSSARRVLNDVTLSSSSMFVSVAAAGVLGNITGWWLGGFDLGNLKKREGGDVPPSRKRYKHLLSSLLLPLSPSSLNSPALSLDTARLTSIVLPCNTSALDNPADGSGVSILGIANGFFRACEELRVCEEGRLEELGWVSDRPVD